MKKFLSLFLAVLMVASIVAMMPVFTVSAATVDTTGRTKVDANISAGVGCGFIDGNANPNDSTNQGVSKLLGVSDNATVLANTKVYVDGVEARFNKTYSGFTHCGRNANDGYYYGIVGAGYTSGVESTLTFLIGDSYYMEATFTPNATAHAVASSHTIYYEGDKTVVTEVTFVNEVNLAVGDSLTLRFHDDHTDRSAKVIAKNGKTITIEAINVTTVKTLCEYKLNDGTWFSLPIDDKKLTTSAVGYIQTRDNADSTKFDTRVIIEANQLFTEGYNRASLLITFTLADGTTREFPASTAVAYKKIIANGEVYTANDGYALFGCAVTGVPKGTASVSAKVTFYNDEDETSKEIHVGSGSLTAIQSSVSDIETMIEYNNTSITLKESNDGKGLDSNANEGPYYLFDGTVKKHGTGNATFTVKFTTAEAIKISGIIFTTANDSYSSNRYYTSWKLEGSNDNGATWNLVASSDIAVNKGTKNYNNSDYASLEAVPDELRDAYKIVTVGEYQYYSFTATGNGSNYNQMGEITFYTAGTLSEVKEMKKYDASNITVTSIDDGRALTDGEGANKLFDGTTQKHGSHNNTFTVYFNTKEAISVSGIIFSHANDSDSYNRYYTSWTLEGKDGDGNWVVVAQSTESMTKPTEGYNSNEISNPDALPDSLRVAYKVTGADSYSEYRLTATGNDQAQYKYNQMAEITLYTAN